MEVSTSASTASRGDLGFIRWLSGISSIQNRMFLTQSGECHLGSSTMVNILSEIFSIYLISPFQSQKRWPLNSRNPARMILFVIYARTKSCAPSVLWSKMTPWHRWFMKKYDLVFRRIGRLKSKHSYLKNLELPPTHTTGSQFLMAK